MTLDDIVTMTRYRLNNAEKPFLWLSQEIVFYANQAIQTICRDAKCLEDSMTLSVCQFFTVSGTMDYLLHPSIIYVKSAKIRSQETITLSTTPSGIWNSGDVITGLTSGSVCTIVMQLTTTTYTVKFRSGQFTLGETLTNGTYTATSDATHPTFTDTTTNTERLVKQSKREMDSYFSSWRAQPLTQPLRYILDYQAGYITLYANPDNYYPIDMTVVRYPLVQMTSATDMTLQTPEINPIWHDAIIEGICWQAYQKRGEDTYDPNLSTIHGQNFRKYILDMKKTNNLYESVPSTASPIAGFI